MLWLLFSSSCPSIQFLPKERKDAEVADTPPACLCVHPKPILTRDEHIWVCAATPGYVLWCRYPLCESAPELPHISEQRSSANIVALRSTCCCPDGHSCLPCVPWDRNGLRVRHSQCLPGKRWHEKLRGLLLEVAGRAENSPLPAGLALKPFSLLLSADVLQRCETYLSAVKLERVFSSFFPPLFSSRQPWWNQFYSDLAVIGARLSLNLISAGTNYRGKRS